jgi:hypothetical protein
MAGARLSGLSWALSIAVAVVLLGSFAIFVVRPMRRRPDLQKTATLLDERHDGPKNLIVNAYQLGRNGSSEGLGYATDLISRGRAGGSTARSIAPGGGNPKRRSGTSASSPPRSSSPRWRTSSPERYRAAATSLPSWRSTSIAPLILVHPGNGEVERGRDFRFAPQ